MRTRLAFVVATALVVGLTGCDDPAANPSDSLDPMVAAGEYCIRQVAATFDEPSTVEFGGLAGGGSVAAKQYTFKTTVTGDAQNFSLTCTVTGDPGSFLLESYQLVPAG